MPKRSAKSQGSNAATTLPQLQEKRLHRYRPACPVKLYDRIHRGTTQRLYLIEHSKEGDGPDEMVFSVLGSTGNVYQVSLTYVSSCTCPDFARKQDLCKHIIFVLTKVVGLDVDDPLVYQRAYVTSELQQLFERVRRRRVGGSVLANQQVRDSYANGALTCHDDDQVKAVNAGTNDEGRNAKRPASSSPDDDCPICFDRLQTEEETTTHCHVCAATFHQDCIRRWVGQRRQNGSSTCPNCRSAWHVDPSGSSQSPACDEGYVNLGALQGQSPVRDASTYRRCRHGW